MFTIYKLSIILIDYKFICSVFLSAVERCLTQPHELGKLFKKYERKLLMYVVYCQNKPISEYLVSEHDYYFEVNFFQINIHYIHSKNINFMSKHLMRLLLTYSIRINSQNNDSRLLKIKNIHCSEYDS